MTRNSTMHPLLQRLQAIIDRPDVETARALREDGWQTPLWFTGSMTHFDDGRVGIQVEANQLGGCDEPVLFLDVEEDAAQRRTGDAPLIQQPLSVVGLLLQQQRVGLAIVHGDDVATLTHSQFMAVHSSVTLLDGPAPRHGKADGEYVNRLSVFLTKAREHGQRHADIRSLHLAAVMAGGAPLQCALLLDASNASVHLERLQALHSEWMQPGDGLILLDPLDLSEGLEPIIALLRQQEPTYTKALNAGWWSRLKQRWQAPRLVILDLDIVDTEATT